MDRTFAVDPLTYVFALDQSFISAEKKNKKTSVISVEMKRAFQAMCKAFGAPFDTISLHGGRGLLPTDFGAQSEIDRLAHCVFHYQLDRMKSICKADPQLSPYADEAQPTYVFSPYFYIPGAKEPNSQEWEAICLQAITAFGMIKSPVEKHAVICFSRSLLKDRNRLLRIATSAMRSGCDACWYWVSDFREEDVTTEELATLTSMVNAANDMGFPLYNLHGGFLSAILSKRGLHGFSHSIGYGESKDVFPVTAGALPTVSYHYNPLHVKASVPDIIRAFSTLGILDAQSFHDNVCDCAICKGTLKGSISNFRKFGDLVLKAGNIRESQTAEAAKRCRFHFLLARRKELDLVNSSTSSDLKILFSRVADEYTQLPPSMRLRDRSHPLKAWLTQLP